MLEFLQKYSGTIKLNNKEVSRQEICQRIVSTPGQLEILLVPKNTIDCSSNINSDITTICVFVKAWMLDTSTDDFAFMQTWNKDIPMPLRFMLGTIEKETTRMYYMKLRGEPNKFTVCSKCGRTLVNPVSKLFGIGPECGSKVGLDSHLFINEKIAKEKLCQIEKTIKEIKWEGWVPKTAIIELKKYN